MFNKIKYIIKADSAQYVILRYITYFIQFINIFLLARFLGTYDFGIYSFILLILQYASYTNFGINESLNADYAIKKSSIFLAQKIRNNAWTLNFVLAIFLILIGEIVLLIFPNLFPEYNFSKYAHLTLLLGIVLNINKLYVTFYKLHGKLFKINFNQIIPNLLLLLLILLMRRKINIFFILVLRIISNTISFIVFQFNLPQKVYFEYKKIFYKRLIVKGTNLTLYNLSFYLMAILTTTFVSIYCSVEDLGQYSFVSSIGNAVTMAGGAFSYIFYPKMINKFASGNYTQITLFLERIRNIYILGTDCVVLLSILLIPIAGIFLPQYKSIGAIFSLYILSKVMINSTSGYAAFLIAKQKERILTLYGFLSIITLVSINIIFAYLQLNMKFIALSLVIASFVYAYLVIRYGRNCLNLRDNIGSTLKEIIGTYRWLIFLTILIYVFIFKELVVLYVGTIVYVFVNRKKLHNILNESYVIVANPNSLNF